MTENPDRVPILGEKEVRDWHPDIDTTEIDNGHLDDWTRDQVDALQFYIQDLSRMMNLDNWDIYIGREASAAHTLASVHPVYGRHIAVIAVSKDWWSFTPEIQRNTIVHELIHVIHNRQTEVIRTTPMSTGLWRTFERETEMMVDHLTIVFASFLPMPPTPEDIALHRANKTGPFATNGH